jgi:hypothetical protein
MCHWEPPLGICTCGRWGQVQGHEDDPARHALCVLQVVMIPPDMHYVFYRLVLFVRVSE